MRTFQTIVKKHFPQGASLGEVLVKITKFDIAPLKLAVLHGAVWIQVNQKGKIDRIRDIRAKIGAEDKVWLYFDEKVLELPTYENPELIAENKHYGVWWKPAGILSQGSQSGDHRSLLRAVEVVKAKPTYLVHRLDRETAGLMLIAYTVEGARELSKLMNSAHMKKMYHAICLGNALERLGESGTLSTPVDGKMAKTHYKVLRVEDNQSYLELEIETGRLHQIRQHLAQVELPIMGDPVYGKGNKNKEGLKLSAYSLELKDPWSGSWKSWKAPQDIF